MDRCSIDDCIFAIIAGRRQQRAAGAVDMEPLRKEHIDLMHVLLEGGIASRVVLDVIGRAQTFAGIEGNLRGLAVGLAACGA